MTDVEAGIAFLRLRGWRPMRAEKARLTALEAAAGFGAESWQARAAARDAEKALRAVLAAFQFEAARRICRYVEGGGNLADSWARKQEGESMQAAALMSGKPQARAL